MDVVIVGAGALGTLLASRLSRSPVSHEAGGYGPLGDAGAAPTDAAPPEPPAQVQVLVRTAARTASLRREAPAARPVGDPSDLRRAALLFLCVKSYQTESAIETLDEALESTSAAVISLQNGWGH